MSQRDMRRQWLTEECQQLVDLRDNDGVPFKELAELFKGTQSSVTQQYYRLRNRGLKASKTKAISSVNQTLNEAEKLIKGLKAKYDENQSVIDRLGKENAKIHNAIKGFEVA